MISGLGQRPLTRDDFLVSELALTEGGVDITSVDVVRLRGLLQSLPPLELHSALLVGQDVRVAVSLPIEPGLILQEVVDDHILIKELLEYPILSLDILLRNGKFTPQKVRDFRCFHELLVALNHAKSHIKVLGTLRLDFAHN
jgi:hypothetical protein